MNASPEDQETLKRDHEKLSKFLDSAAYQEIIDRQDLKKKDRTALLKLPQTRNRLGRALLKVFAADIAELDDEFKSLLQKMRAVRSDAEVAADGLKKTADRIQSAVNVAKGVDDAIKLAAAFA